MAWALQSGRAILRSSPANATEVMELGSFWSERVIEIVEVDSDFNSQIKISFDVPMIQAETCTLSFSEGVVPTTSCVALLFQTLRVEMKTFQP